LLGQSFDVGNCCIVHAYFDDMAATELGREIGGQLALRIKNMLAYEQQGLGIEAVPAELKDGIGDRVAEGLATLKRLLDSF
jgi:hypothetical protein